MKPVEVVLFMEAYCPYCNYVHKFVLRDIQVRRTEINAKLRREHLPPIPPIDIRIVDVNANTGSVYSKWYEWYSRKIGGRFTPLIKIGNKIFYLWSEKPETLEQKEVSKAQNLKAQIINELIDISRRVEKEPKFVGEIRPEIRVTNHRVLGKTGVIAFWR
ncbi:MAG: hypothetical protein DRP18_04395 [Candidatus Aenigmatarchaeota archaeon]|nr:MAG: hypothetical protein DRP18_04395 [Candidatus Aenigmarchaeota archaeon]HDD57554.1 hypothetical protein [Thermoplasmatales archaeon]